MSKPSITDSVRSQQRFFNTSTACFDEADSNFAPKPSMFTVAQQISHTAQTVRWFVDGAFNSEGMTMDFEGMEKEVRRVTSLAAARKEFDDAYDYAVKIIESKSAADFTVPIAGHIMTGEPREAIFQAMADHTAHHRGALAVYARLIEKVPAMPYM
ncbi:MAG: DinB family protein [Planctomycetota bacterium]